MTHVVHTIPPTFDARSRVLVLGSVPSPKSREVGFNYGHPQNRFWRVLAALADEPVPTATERRRDFCLRHHIALWDVVAECDIEGASDTSIRNARPNNLSLITSEAPIEAVFCTGAKAHELYRKLGCEDDCGFPAVKLPSTSPANAACKMDDLMEAYAAVLAHEHPYHPPVLDVARVVKLEQQIAESGTSLAELMDRAGAALARRIVQAHEAAHAPKQGSESAPAHDAKPAQTPNSETPTEHETARSPKNAAQTARTVIFCGNGNNGGDGWVAAELLAQAGRPVAVICAKGPDELRAQPARDAAERSFTTLHQLAAGAKADTALQPLVLVNPEADEIERACEQAAIIVDCILGTGFDSNAVKAPFDQWVEAINRHGKRACVIAADVPSGVSAQNGYGPTCSHPRVVADQTVTMIAPKPGLTSPECGKVHVAPLAYIEPFLA